MLRFDRSWPGLAVRLVSAVALLCAPLGCTGLNPAFIASIGGNPTDAINAGTGYVVLLLVNTSTVGASIAYTFTKPNQGQSGATIGIAPLDWSATTYQCDLQDIEILTLTYSYIEIDPNGGAGQVQTVTVDINERLIGGVNLQCGQVVTVTISGTPPAIYATVEVF